MPPKAQTDSLTTVKLSLNHLLDLALTKRTTPLGGKLTTHREDIASAIRIIELTLPVQDLQPPPLHRLLALLNEAPSYIVNAWLQVTAHTVAAGTIALKLIARGTPCRPKHRPIRSRP